MESAEPLLLKLYVTGLTTRSTRAIAATRRLCEAELAGSYELQIIDVLERPDQAEHDKILATPTLIKRHPGPERRVIGDLSDAARVLAALELEALPSAPAPEAD